MAANIVYTHIKFSVAKIFDDKGIAITCVSSTRTSYFTSVFISLSSMYSYESIFPYIFEIISFTLLFILIYFLIDFELIDYGIYSISTLTCLNLHSMMLFI